MRRTEIAHCLLQAGADLHATFMGGLTALHIAAETGFQDIIKIFNED